MDNIEFLITKNYIRLNLIDLGYFYIECKMTKDSSYIYSSYSNDIIGDVYWDNKVIY